MITFDLQKYDIRITTKQGRRTKVSIEKGRKMDLSRSQCFVLHLGRFLGRMLDVVVAFPNI